MDPMWMSVEIVSGQKPCTARKSRRRHGKKAAAAAAAEPPKSSRVGRVFHAGRGGGFEQLVVGCPPPAPYSRGK